MLTRQRLHRMPLITGLLAIPAAAQPAAHIELAPKWRAWPSNQNQLLMFMDSAEVWVDAQIQPGLGSQVSYTPGPGPGIGTLEAILDVQFELRACDVPLGTWTLSGAGFHGQTGGTFGLRSGWHFGWAGSPQLSGSVTGIQPSLFYLPGLPVTHINPVHEIWRGRWDYQSFQPGARLRFSAIPIAAHALVNYSTTSIEYVVVPVGISALAPVEIFIDTGAPPPCFIFFTSSPQDAAASAGGAVSFDVAISQVPGPNCTVWYQWRRDCVPLGPGPRYTGVQGPQLTINPVQTSDAGRYDVLVNGSHSYTALLTVACYANCDSSTSPPVLNVADFACFLNAFAAGDPYANCDGSTTAPILNVADFSCFLTKFAAGCN